MTPTLADIVSNALSGAETKTKLASARDARPAAAGSLDFLDSELSSSEKIAGDDSPFDHEDDEGKKKAKDKDKKDEPEKKASFQAILDDADFGMKLAEALDVGAGLISSKLASDGTALSAPGPQVHESGMNSTPVQVPKAQANVSDKITGPTVDGPPGTGLPTTKSDFTSTSDRGGAPHNHPGGGKTASDITRDRGAATAMLRAKVAQAETMIELGQDAEAERLLREVEAVQAKLAQDPSSPQPVMPAHSNAFMLSTEPGGASHIPDNAGLINMTKAQAKDSTVRETTQHFSETPKKDNAVPAHTLRADGQKISHVLQMKTASDHQEQKDETKAKAEKERKEKEEAEKKAAASFNPEVGRALLAQAIKTAQDQNADPVMRQKAASLLTKVKGKLGVDPSTLLG